MTVGGVAEIKLPCIVLLLPDDAACWIVRECPSWSPEVIAPQNIVGSVDNVVVVVIARRKNCENLGQESKVVFR